MTCNLQMVTDQSAGKFSLNSMIAREDIRSYPLDNMKHLGEVLLATRRHRLLPMHPHWQIKQVNTLDGVRYIDRCNAFGGRGSGSIWIVVYADDSFKVVESSAQMYYAPFNQRMPIDQVKLLDLWSELGIPFKQKKQVNGAPLTIIGIEVDPNAMTFTMPEQARLDLIHEIETFVSPPTQSKGAKHTLRDWQRLAGWLNWAFNVFPLLRPCLNNFYPKIVWATEHLRTSSGIHLLNASDWDSGSADVTIYCDASSIRCSRRPHFLL